MATLNDVLAAVTAERTMIDSVGALISGLKQQVTDALAKSGITTEDQAKIDTIFSEAEGNRSKLAEAISVTPDSSSPPVAPGTPTPEPVPLPIPTASSDTGSTPPLANP